MSEIVKGVLGGGWTLLVGWFFPIALSAALFGVLVLPSLAGWAPADSVLAAEPVTQTLLLTATTVVVGLVFSALQTPLYRVLEGYLFWPRRLQRRRSEKHVARLRKLRNEAKASHGLSRALRREQVRRYPADLSQVAPTLLGNAIRRFETYGFDRYQLDSQLLWSQLRAVAPESAAKQTDEARAGVDFFVCLLYSQAILAGSALGAWAAMRPGDSLRLVLTAVAAVGLMVVCYRMAIVATDSWAAAVRCLVDTGRVPLAKVYGLIPPPEFSQERQMWRGVNWLVRLPYEPELADYLDAWRTAPSDKVDSSTATNAGHETGSSASTALPPQRRHSSRLWLYGGPWVTRAIAWWSRQSR